MRDVIFFQKAGVIIVKDSRHFESEEALQGGDYLKYDLPTQRETMNSTYIHCRFVQAYLIANASCTYIHIQTCTCTYICRDLPEQVGLVR